MKLIPLDKRSFLRKFADKHLHFHSLYQNYLRHFLNTKLLLYLQPYLFR